jgi:hypothetical protein
MRAVLVVLWLAAAVVAVVAGTVWPCLDMICR